ncbi:MAG: LCP family protein [Tetrasphaera sp.]
MGYSLLATVSLTLTGVASATYLKLNANITRVDITPVLGTRPPRPTSAAASEGAPEPMTIVVMGSDTRQGIGTTEYGKDTVEGGAHSDTNLIVHFFADRQHVLVVSIPRDSMTMAPKDCADPKSTVKNGAVRQWNYNFNEGGPGCVVKTVEGLTGIFVDHFAVVDFRGFQDMVDALGGVEVCTTSDIDDADSQFTLAAGRHRLDGKQALGYVRVRKTVSDGSDLNRIKRQQAFLSSVAQQATSSKLLLRPDRLFGFLNAATKSLTSDPGLTLPQMTAIARSVRSIGMENVEFVTVPTEVYAPDPNRVKWKASAETIWRAIRDDVPLDKPSSSTTPSSAGVAGKLTVRPDKISVSISNDSGVDGLAVQAGDALRVQGFTIAGYANGAAGGIDGVVVRYAPGRSEEARTVAAAFPGAVLKVDKRLDKVIAVNLGVGAANPVLVPNRVGTAPLPPMTITATAPDEIERRTAAADICS